MLPADPREVLDFYPDRYQPLRSEVLGSRGGFSGAVIVRLDCSAGEFCLRGWPPAGLPRERIVGLHRLLSEVARRGVSQVAVPVASLDGGTLVTVQNRQWQLEPWMPGKADYWQHQSETRLRAAMACLADWHRAAARFQPCGGETAWFGSQADAPSPAVSERLEQIQRWNRDRCERLRRRLAHSDRTEFQQIGLRVLELYQHVSPHVAGQLRAARKLGHRLQPCLRDVWHDHVLFTGDAVTGLIDASACRCENVATDLARLVGSLAGDNRGDWEIGLDEYQRHLPLTLDEIALCAILDRSTVLLSSMTWLDRCYLQVSEALRPAGRQALRPAGRQPDSPTARQSERVVTRMRVILERLETLSRNSLM